MTSTDDDARPTVDRLRTLIKDDEPRFQMSHVPAVREGKRLTQRRHRRRLGGLAALSVAAVTIVVMAVAGDLPVVPFGLHDNTTVAADSSGRQSEAVRPSTAPGAKGFTAAEAETVLEEEARRLLGQYTDLGPATLSTPAGSGVDLSSRDAAGPAQLQVTFNPTPGRQLSVSIARSKSEAEGDLDAYCDDGLAAGYFLTCQVGSTGPFPTVFTEARVVPQGRNGRLGYAILVPGGDLPMGTKPGPVSVQRTVKAIRSDDVVSYATETVEVDATDPAAITVVDPQYFAVTAAALYLAATSTEIDIPSRD